MRLRNRAEARVNPVPKWKRDAMLGLVRKCLSPRMVVLVLQLRRYRRTRRTQGEMLQHVLLLCDTTVPYYKRTFNQLPRGEAVQFMDFPTMSKTTLQDNFAELISVRPRGVVRGASPFWIRRTSGSSGIVSSILKSRADVLANISIVREIFREYKVPRFGHMFDLGVHGTDQPVAQARVFPGAFVCWNFTGYRLDRSLVRQECIDILQHRQAQRDLRRAIPRGALRRALPIHRRGSSSEARDNHL